MRSFLMVCTTLGSVLGFVVPASAANSGLQVVGTPVIAGGASRTMYRVYATFTDANDYLTVVNGSPTGSLMVIQSRNSNDTAAGSDFFNPVISHGTSPTPVEVFGGVDGGGIPIPPIPDAVFDTFFTLGVGAGQYGSGPDGYDQTWNQNMPANFIMGNSFSTANGGWFLVPVEQNRAGWLGDGDPLLRVLMMQLTVNAGDNVRGTMNISGINNTPLAGGQSFTISGQTFNSIPAPGCLVLLTLAGLMQGSRRREV